MITKPQIQIVTLSKGLDCGISIDKFGSIKDPQGAKEFVRIWQKYHSNAMTPPLLPQVDFSKDVVLYGSYAFTYRGSSIEISQVQKNGSSLEMLVDVQSPSNRIGIVGQKIIYSPYHIIKIDKIDFDYVRIRKKP